MEGVKVAYVCSDHRGRHMIAASHSPNLDQKIDNLIDGDLGYQLMLSENGSGRGAALVAAVARRMKNERNGHGFPQLTKHFNNIPRITGYPTYLILF